MRISRRHLLQSAAVALPTLWIPRRARAASTRASGSAKHLLVLFAKGGFRSHCTFNAVGSPEHNPFGTQPNAAGTEWTLGAACGAQAITTSRGRIAPLAEISRDVAVIACVDHLPGGAAVDVDHRTAVNRIATGEPEGTTGLLARIGKHHPLYAQGFGTRAVPPVEIGPTELGYGSGDFAETRPLSLFGGGGASFTSQLPIGQGWKIGARSALDARFLEGRSRAFRGRIGNWLRAKGNATELAEVLGSPLLDLAGQPDERRDGVSNRELIEVLGDHPLTDLGDAEAFPSWGGDVAMALRFFSLGTPVVAVTRDIYDMHDEERTRYAPRTQDLARQLAGLHHLLHAMDHPSGGTYWDHTLVVVMSEFSRNNTLMSGFNSGNGSDHVGEAAGPARNQAIAVMGGMVTAGGKRLGATDERMNALDRVYSSRSLLSTMLDVVGVDPSRYWADAPIGELFS